MPDAKDTCANLPLPGDKNPEQTQELCNVSKSTGVPIEKLINQDNGGFQLNADKYCEMFPGHVSCEIGTDTVQEHATTSFDPTMWGALFFIWVLLYIPRLVIALKRGADKFEPSMFEGWWIAGIAFLFWGYNVQIPFENAAGWLFVTALIFWPLWFKRGKIAKRISGFSKRGRVLLSGVVIWVLFAFAFAFGSNIWDEIAREDTASFLFILFIPPIFTALLWGLYRWVKAAPKP